MSAEHVKHLEDPKIVFHVAPFAECKRERVPVVVFKPDSVLSIFAMDLEHRQPSVMKRNQG